jgi:hypothetical protein
MTKRWARRITYTREIRNLYRVLVDKPKGSELIILESIILK